MPILNGSQILARARRLTEDYVEPYYISDTEMYIWITEAERALAVAGKLLRDVVTYNVIENQRWLNLKTSPEIIEFNTATLIDSNDVRFRMKLIGTMDPTPLSEDDDDYGLISLTNQLTPSRPESLIFGKKTNYAELSPVSNGSYSIECTVVTYPRYPIENAGDEPTVQERYHQYLPIGAAVLAMQGFENEHFDQRIQTLMGAWSAALGRAADEAGRMNRDTGQVQFTNEMWV